MTIADDLQKLEELRASGALSDDEFQEAKARLLHEPAQQEPAQQEDFLSETPQETLGQAANRYVSLEIVSRVIGGIIALLIFLFVFLPMFCNGPFHGGLPR